MTLRSFCGRFVTGTLVCLGSAASAYSQSYPIPEGIFAKTAEEGLRLAEKKTRRLESEWRTFKNGSVVKSGTSIGEYVPPGRQRQYHRVVEGSSVKETETILIGSVEYSRENGGAWTKTKIGGMGMGSGAGGKSVAQATKELTTLNGNEVELFEEFKIEGNGYTLRFYRNRIWIGRDGLLLKQELSSGTVEPRMNEDIEVITYRYDSTIKIEPPIK